MPTKLKRLNTNAYPLFYMKKRGSNFILQKVDQSLFVRPDDLELIEADIEIRVKDDDKKEAKPEKKE